MNTIDLNGEWRVSYAAVRDVPIQVPGAVESILVDRTYAGPFVYRRILKMEALEERASYVLQFGGVSYACEVYCNDVRLCEHEGLWDGFQADATGALRQGDNVIEVRVVKPDFEKGSPYYFRSVLFGFIPDVMLPFGGIWKDVSLAVKGRTYFDRVACRFDTDSGSVVLDSRLHRGDAPAELAVDLALAVTVTGPDGESRMFRKPYEERAVIGLDDVQVWSPDAPNVYRVEAVLLVNGTAADTHSVRGGFRRIEVQDGEVLLNGEPFYMRGVLHWGCYPEKMTPAPTYEEVKDELRKLKDSGFNAIKHCLYFPPSYYYELCDELGIVTWQELPLWLPTDDPRMLERIYDQYPKMLDLFMHSPSVTFVSLGCELDATISGDTLNDLYRMVKEREPQAIICDNSGSGECFEGVSNSMSDIYDYHFYAELYELDALINEFTRSYRETKPWLFGEYNDSDTFRLNRDRADRESAWWLNPDEKANLLRLVHKGFGSDQPVYEQERILAEYGVQDEVAGLPELSVRQMHSIRKYILELTRSYREIKGYNITTIADVPITTSGVFDEYMEPKIDPADMRRINGDIVVSLNKDLARIWDHGADRFFHQDPYNYFSEGTLKGRLSLSNRSGRDLSGAYEVILRDDSRVFFSHRGELNAPKHRVGQLAQLAIRLPNVETAEAVKRCELIVRLTFEGGMYENSWDIWVYPTDLAKASIHVLDHSGGLRGVEDLFNVKRLTSAADAARLGDGDLLVTTAFDASMEEAVQRGLRVIALQPGEGYFPIVHHPFYREGVKAILDHPVSRSLGHIGYAGMQFYGVGTDRCFDKLAMERRIGRYTPIVRRYDARKFHVADYLLEYRSGRGRVLASTLNLDGGQGSQPHSFQHSPFAVWLLHAMIDHFATAQ